MNNRLVSLGDFAKRLSVYGTNPLPIPGYTPVKIYMSCEWYNVLHKWNRINRSQIYKNLRNEVHMVVTFENLYCHRKTVIKTLLKYLALNDDKCMESVIELIKAVAYDLGQAFHPYMFIAVKLIIKSLDSKNPDVLEAAFVTLAYFFGRHQEYFSQYFVKSIDMLMPLMRVAQLPEYVKNFATDSVIFIIRNVIRRDMVLRPLFDVFKVNNATRCGQLLAQVITNAAGEFHVCAKPFLTAGIDALKHDTTNEKLVFDILREIFINLKTTLRPVDSEILWQVIFTSLDNYSVVPAVNEESARILSDVMYLTGLLVSHKQGEMLLDPEKLASRIYKVVINYENNEEVFQEAKDLTVAIMAAEHSCLTGKYCYLLAGKIADILDGGNTVSFTERLVDHLTLAD